MLDEHLSFIEIAAEFASGIIDELQSSYKVLLSEPLQKAFIVQVSVFAAGEFQKITIHLFASEVML